MRTERFNAAKMSDFISGFAGLVTLLASLLTLFADDLHLADSTLFNSLGKPLISGLAGALLALALVHAKGRRESQGRQH